jgi:hypothetical protein
VTLFPYTTLFRSQSKPSQEGAARPRGVAAMPEILSTKRDPAGPRFRGIVATMLLILLSVLIVRDIIARRWGSPPAAPDVTQRSP